MNLFVACHACIRFIFFLGMYVVIYLSHLLENGFGVARLIASYLLSILIWFFGRCLKYFFLLRRLMENSLGKKYLDLENMRDIFCFWQIFWEEEEVPVGRRIQTRK